MKIPTFPDYRIDQINYYDDPGYQVISNLRIKYDGIWYLVFHRSIAQTQEEAIRAFIDATYKSILFYKVDPKLTYNPFGKEELVNKPDSEQRGEFTRLFPLKKPVTE